MDDIDDLAQWIQIVKILMIIVQKEKDFHISF